MFKNILIGLLFVIIVQPVFGQGIERIDIQKYFNQTPGNASIIPFWKNNYLNKKVSWKGTIFSMEYQKDFSRTEVTMKILPETIMYDTVVYIPGNIKDKFNLKDDVTFTGTIVKGVDLFGVKEVQVDIGKNSGDSFGNYIFSDNNMINVNFLQPNNTTPSK